MSDWDTHRNPPPAGLSDWEDLWVRFGPAAEIGRGLRGTSLAQDDLVWLCDLLIKHLRGDDVLTYSDSRYWPDENGDYELSPEQVPER